MELIELSLDQATKLHKKLSEISPRAGINGYLTGMIQDVQRCIKVNFAGDPDNDKGDDVALEEIVEKLEDVEMTLSQYMRTAIVRG